MEVLAFITVVVAVIVAWRVRRLFHRVTIFEFQRGLKYSRGKFAQVLAPGQYWIFGYTEHVSIIDVRPRFISVGGQEVLTSDGVTLKVSIACEYEVGDPATAINRAADFNQAFYLTVQMALREVIGNTPIDALLQNRNEIGAKLKELATAKAGELGLRVISANVKDIMFPGELKKVFSQVVKAQKEGQAALERARGETAALRSLANAARLMQDNPSLLHVRLLQHLGETAGNTVVLGIPTSNTPIPIRGKELSPVDPKSGAPADE